MNVRWTVLVLASLCLGTGALRAQPVDAPGWFAQANQLYRAKDYDGALASYAQGLRIDNRSALGYEGVGNCFASKGDIPHALKYYGWSLQLAPNAALQDYVTRLRAGAAPTLASANRLYHQGAFDRALAAYLKLTQLNPSDAKAFQGMGNAYYAEGLQTEAMAQYHKALDLDPSNKALADFVAAHERVATASAGPRPADWLQPGWRSLILPGWGQFYNQEPTKGLILGGLTLGSFVGVVSTYVVGESAMTQYHAATGTNQAAYNTPYNTWATMADWNHVFYIGVGVLYTYTLIDAIVGAKPSPVLSALLNPDAPVQVLADSREFGVKARVLSF